MLLNKFFRCSTSSGVYFFDAYRNCHINVKNGCNEDIVMHYPIYLLIFATLISVFVIKPMIYLVLKLFDIGNQIMNLYIKASSVCNAL